MMVMLIFLNKRKFHQKVVIKRFFTPTFDFNFLKFALSLLIYFPKHMKLILITISMIILQFAM